MGSVFSCFNKVASKQSDQRLEEEPSDRRPQGSWNSSEVSVSSAVTNDEALIEDPVLEELCEVARDEVVDDLAGDITDHLGKRNEKIPNQMRLRSVHSITSNQSIMRESVRGYRVRTSGTRSRSSKNRTSRTSERREVSHETRGRLASMLESMMDVREKSRLKRKSEWSRTESQRSSKGLQNMDSSRKSHKFSPAINNSSRSTETSKSSRKKDIPKEENTREDNFDMFNF